MLSSVDSGTFSRIQSSCFSVLFFLLLLAIVFSGEKSKHIPSREFYQISVVCLAINVFFGPDRRSGNDFFRLHRNVMCSAAGTLKSLDESIGRSSLREPALRGMARTRVKSKESKEIMARNQVKEQRNGF